MNDYITGLQNQAASPPTPYLSGLMNLALLSVAAQLLRICPNKTCMLYRHDLGSEGNTDSLKKCSWLFWCTINLHTGPQSVPRLSCVYLLPTIQLQDRERFALFNSFFPSLLRFGNSIISFNWHFQLIYFSQASASLYVVHSSASYWHNIQINLSKLVSVWQRQTAVNSWCILIVHFRAGISYKKKLQDVKHQQIMFKRVWYSIWNILFRIVLLCWTNRPRKQLLAVTSVFVFILMGFQLSHSFVILEQPDYLFIL